MAGQLPTIVRMPEQFLSDDRRVITRFFRPGNDARVESLLGRLVRLDREKVNEELAYVLARFGSRHRDLEAVFDDHYQTVAPKLHAPDSLSDQHRRLIGAYFTMEYSIEAAALFNPSIVPHFDQSELTPGARRFIMSLRATGEGHISSIVFRTGVISSTGQVSVSPPSRFVSSAQPDLDAIREKNTFFLKLIEMGAFTETTGRILDRLDEQFVFGDLVETIDDMRPADKCDSAFEEAAEQMLWLARSNYTVRYPADCRPSEVVVFPVTENESRGIEDARFVQFTDDDGSETYYGTYTAYNGFRILPQLLSTQDFRSFNITTLNGKCAQNKGMALFPRKINGRYVMISRQDGENLHVMSSTNIRFWNEATLLRAPEHRWELIQIGNCGSPIETDEGWLLLTHGVGPMRRYCIGADLLDLDDPTKVIAHAVKPLICPNEREREGYVPNVVYSCGALLHNDRLVIPYAMADSASSFITISMRELLDYLLG